MLTLNSNQHPIVYIQAALDETRSGRYFTKKSGSQNELGLQRIEGAAPSLDTVIKDTVDLNVSEQGETLSRLNKQSVRHLGKSLKNQKAARSSFGSAYHTLDEVKDSLSLRHRRDIEMVQKTLHSLDGFKAAGQKTNTSYQNLKGGTPSHISIIRGDRAGVDVSDSGVQLDSLYQSSKTSLESAKTDLSKTDQRLSNVIAILEDIASDIEP